jgi:hypothetical protein
MHAELSAIGLREVPAAQSGRLATGLGTSVKPERLFSRIGRPVCDLFLAQSLLNDRKPDCRLFDNNLKIQLPSLEIPA